MPIGAVSHHRQWNARPAHEQAALRPLAQRHMPRIFTRFSRALHAILTPALLHWRPDLCEQDKDEAMLLVQCAGHERQVCGTGACAVLTRRFLTWLDSLS